MHGELEDLPYLLGDELRHALGLAFGERGRRVLRISGATGEGVEPLVDRMAEAVDEARREETKRLAEAEREEMEMG